MKVYVLVNEWAYDYAQDMNVQVFMFESEAQKAMKEGYEDFVSHNFDADGVFNVKEYYDDNASVHSDGDWSCNHIAWNIYERDLNDGAEPVVWLAKEDLAFHGFATECEDVSLKTIASKMSDYYCECGGYSEDLVYACDHYRWPRTK